MIIFERVPTGLFLEVNISVDDYAIRVKCMLKAFNVCVSHEFSHLCDEILSLLANFLSGFLSDRRITNALEEFNALLTFKVL
jgi:hypothetical protein